MSKTTETTERIDLMSNSIGVATKKIQEAGLEIASLGKNLEVFDKLTSSSIDSENSIAALRDSMVSLSEIASSMPGFELQIETAKALNDSFQTAILAGAALDEPTEKFRMFTSAVNLLGRSFGMTEDEANKLRGSIAKMASDSENADFYFSAKELTDTALGLMEVGVSSKFLEEEVSTLNNSFNATEAVLFKSRVTGDSVSSTMSQLKKDIYDVGMTVEDSTLQFAGINLTSGKTGLSMDTVRSALEGASASFRTLGMSTDFAKPFLEGFVTTLEKVGLGIGNASSLAASMSRAIGSLATDYGKAYFTFQQGGLDFGGSGGVLGAGLGLRARMLEAEKTGEQGDMALDMAKAMRQTIQNMTGRDIVTVQEAAGDPALEAIYAIQESIMKDYGISGTEADRTLELLKDLDGTQNTSKEELKERLDKLNEDTKSVQEKTFSEQQKANASLSKMIAQNTVANESYVAMLELMKISALRAGDITEGEMMKLSKSMSEAQMRAFELLGDKDNKNVGLQVAAVLSQNTTRNTESSLDENAKIKSERNEGIMGRIEVVLKATGGLENLIQTGETIEAVVSPANPS
jgi:hypothetical protein